MKSLKNRILDLLRYSDNLFDILSSLDESIHLVAQALRELDEEGLIRVSGGKIQVKVRPKAEEEVQSTAWSSKHKITSDVLLERFVDLVKDRPSPVTEFDQGYVTPLSVVKRVSLLRSRDDLYNSRVLVLGDDDLTSIALSLTAEPKEIVVAEIDARLVEFINKIWHDLDSKKASASPVRAILYDVRKPLPSELRRSFSVCVTDPLETYNGFSLFIKRAADALRGPGDVLLFGLTDLECPIEKWHRFQQMLLKIGFVIKDIIRDSQRYLLGDNDFVFKEYPSLKKYKPASSYEGLWYHSSLVRAQAAKELDTDWISVKQGANIYVDPPSEAG